MLVENDWFLEMTGMGELVSLSFDIEIWMTKQFPSQKALFILYIPWRFPAKLFSNGPASGH